MAFRSLDNPVDITASLDTTGWQTYDASGDVPSYATGVMVQLLAGVSFDVDGGVRPVDATHEVFQSEIHASKQEFPCSLKTAQFQVFRNNSNLDVRITGYFYSNFAFFDEPVDKSPGTASSWQTVDVSGDVPGTAEAAIVMTRYNSNTTGVVNMGVRPTGSRLSEDSLRGLGVQLYVVKIDVNGHFEAYNGNSSFGQVYLLGYVEDGTWFADPENRNYVPGAGGSWQTVAIPEMTVGGAAFFLVNGFNDDYGLRNPGSGDANVDQIGSTVSQTLATVNSNAQATPEVEIFAEDTGVNLWLFGWFDGKPAKPSGTALTQILSDSVTLGWDRIPEDDSGVRVEWDKSGDGNFASPVPNLWGAGQTSDTEGFANANTHFHVRVRASNQYGDGPWSDVIEGFTNALAVFTALNPIKDAGGNDLLNVVVVFLRQSQLDSVAATAIGEDVTLSARANKLTAYPAEVEVPGGDSADKLLCFSYKTGIVGEVHPDLDPTTTG